MVIKETQGAALLLKIPKIIHSHDGHNQRGSHLPDIRMETLSKLGELHVFRAKKIFDENNQLQYLKGKEILFFFDDNHQIITHRGPSTIFSIWNKKPNYFDYYD